MRKTLDFNSNYDSQLLEEHKEIVCIRNHPKGKNPGDFLSSNEGKDPGDLLVSSTAKSKYKHFAVFPEAIPELAIKSTCPFDGIVLDPFAGSGTTGVVARRLKRRSILIDIQRDFIEIMKQRVKYINIYNE